MEDTPDVSVGTDERATANSPRDPGDQPVPDK